MPRMNGLEAAREIATEVPDTKIVLFTAYDSAQLQKDAKRFGIKAVLSKHGARVLDQLIRAVKEVGESRAA